MNDPELKRKLDCIINSRNTNEWWSTIGKSCIVNDTPDGKISLSIYVDQLNRHIYTFKVHDTTVATYDNLMGDNRWRTTRSWDNTKTCLILTEFFLKK